MRPVSNHEAVPSLCQYYTLRTSRGHNHAQVLLETLSAAYRQCLATTCTNFVFISALGLFRSEASLLTAASLCVLLDADVRENDDQCLLLQGPSGPSSPDTQSGTSFWRFRVGLAKAEELAKAMTSKGTKSFMLISLSDMSKELEKFSDESDSGW